MHIGIFIYLKSSMAMENVVHDIMYIYTVYYAVSVADSDIPLLCLQTRQYQNLRCFVLIRSAPLYCKI